MYLARQFIVALLLLASLTVVLILAEKRYLINFGISSVLPGLVQMIHTFRLDCIVILLLIPVNVIGFQE